MRDFFNSFSRGFPTSLFKPFFARFSVSKFTELFIIGIAPSLFRSFSEIFSTLSVSFWERATPMHSPPSVPKSLSLMAKDVMVKFLIKRAAIQTAPCIPREFLRIELSTTPRSRFLILVLVIRSSRRSSRPSPLIMLEARLSEISFEESLMMFLTAYIPWSVMALSASCNFSKGRFLIELESAIIELMPRRKVYRLRAFEFLTFLFRSSSLKIFALSTAISEASVIGSIFTLTSYTLTSVVASSIEQVGVKLVFKEFADRCDLGCACPSIMRTSPHGCWFWLSVSPVTGLIVLDHTEEVRLCFNKVWDGFDFKIKPVITLCEFWLLRSQTKRLTSFIWLLVSFF